MIKLTEQAADYIKKIVSDTTNPTIRVAVIGGGCHGFSAKIFEEKTFDSADTVFEQYGVTVVLDPDSSHLLQDAEIVLKDGLVGGLAVVHPEAASTCGCGQSFSF